LALLSRYSPWVVRDSLSNRQSIPHKINLVNG
jgi:hypothetical protein